jgi:hypothetical protein
MLTAALMDPSLHIGDRIRLDREECDIPLSAALYSCFQEYSEAYVHFIHHRPIAKEYSDLLSALEQGC